MNRLKFRCTLLSDVVLSQTSSSEGNQRTLDFIPGSNFLGIVADYLYNKVEADNQTAWAIIHSGKVRFGDANPSVDGIRGLKVPASMYYPKLGKASDCCYIHHLTDHEHADIKELQLKQCREGFFAFKTAEHVGKPVSAVKDFTIKSAYDPVHRKSEKGKLFGYESLSKGLVLFFEIESELDNSASETIIKALEGKKQLGHSRTAEYGLVEIKQDNDYAEIPSAPGAGDEVTVYADGRLIFLDSNGEPTFQPTADQLLGNDKEHLTSAEIVWEKSQIRIFQYAPWNGKRHTYDTDRCGIEKGSVFVIRLKDASCPQQSQYVGAYRNEGFGKIIYNPVFLTGREDGIALFTLAEKEDRAEKAPMTTDAKKVIINPLLIDYLQSAKKKGSASRRAYSIVEGTLTGAPEKNNILAELKSRFAVSEAFASQWGSIRSLAMSIPNATRLITAIDSFLDHGVAQAKWNELRRKKLLDQFMDAHKEEPNFDEIMINLASEMAKKCSKRKEAKK